MSFFEAKGIGWSSTVHGGFLAQAGVNVDCGEESDGHREVVETEGVGEHGASEKVGELQCQGKPVAILAPNQIPNLFFFKCQEQNKH